MLTRFHHGRPLGGNAIRIDPYALHDTTDVNDGDDWGLGAFAARVKRNSVGRITHTYQRRGGRGGRGGGRGRVGRMEVGRRKAPKTTRSSTTTTEFSSSTLAFGREAEARSSTTSEESSVSESRKRKMKKKKKRKKSEWSASKFPVIRVNVDSDDDQCFLCKYTMEK